MAVILFYSPFNQRSRDSESLMIAFKNEGHKVISLSQQEGFEIHDFLRLKGIETYSHVIKGKRSGILYFFRHLIYFIFFCWRHRIDVVYSHLEPANFVASVGQYFILGKTFLCRHHIDEGLLYNFHKDLYYRLTYKLAKRIIVVSNHAKRYMVEVEKIPIRKIIHINLAYDFSLYKPIDWDSVRRIRQKNNQAEITLLSACRLTKYKRPDIAVNVIKKLVDDGFDVKLIMLGKGEMQSELEQQILSSRLADQVSIEGYVSNVLDYMAAADFFLHPSILDSSCVAVKEAGLAELPVIACRGIGDFDDYLQHGVNAFLVDQEKFVQEAVDLIKHNFRDKRSLKQMGMRLRTDVIRLFDVSHIAKQYEQYNSIPRT